MKYTSAEAAKLIKSLNEQRSALATEIIKKSTFPAAMGEDPETGVQLDGSIADA